jgi:hypothetical protein
MFRIENVVGRLVEIHVTDLRSMEEMEQFGFQVMETVKAVPGRAVSVVDLRLPRIFAPDVAESLEEMLRRANPKIERSAILLAPSHAIFALQLERLIREAANPARRSFRDPTKLREWAADILSEAEQARLATFVR